MASEEILVSWKNCRVTRGDAALFREGQWLNDACITFAFEYLSSQRAARGAPLPTQLPPPSLIAGSVAPAPPEPGHAEGALPSQAPVQAEESPTSLRPALLLGAETVFWLANEDDAEDLADAAESLELRRQELILCPINDHTDVTSAGGTHWSLLVAWLSNGVARRFEHYDSMGSANVRAARRFARRLGDTCGDGAGSSRNQAEFIEMPAARQENSCDCGVYVLLFADAVLNEFDRGRCDFSDAVGRLRPLDATRRRQEALDAVVASLKPSVAFTYR